MTLRPVVKPVKAIMCPGTNLEHDSVIIAAQTLAYSKQKENDVSQFVVVVVLTLSLLFLTSVCSLTRKHVEH